jgi:hypothetical protein
MCLQVWLHPYRACVNSEASGRCYFTCFHTVLFNKCPASVTLQAFRNCDFWRPQKVLLHEHLTDMPSETPGKCYCTCLHKVLLDICPESFTSLQQVRIPVSCPLPFRQTRAAFKKLRKNFPLKGIAVISYHGWKTEHRTRLLEIFCDKWSEFQCNSHSVRKSVWQFRIYLHGTKPSWTYML